MKQGDKERALLSGVQHAIAKTCADFDGREPRGEVFGAFALVAVGGMVAIHGKEYAEGWLVACLADLRGASAGPDSGGVH